MKHITHPFGPSVNVNLEGPIVSTEPVVSTVLIEKLSNGHLVRRSDIHLLLHQEKLAVLGERVTAAYVDSMQSTSASPNYNEGLSDSQIISTIKSKYLQQPSELSAWMDHLKELALAEVNSTKAQTSKKTVSTEEQANPSKTSESTE